MLVIDLVELVAGHRLEKVRKFDRADTIRLQDQADTFNEGIQIRNLSEDIIAKNKIGLNGLFGQLSRGLDAKELHQRRNSALFRGPRNVRRGVNAEDGNPPLDKELQEITVIAAELDDPARRPEAEPVGHHL